MKNFIDTLGKKLKTASKEEKNEIIKILKKEAEVSRRIINDYIERKKIYNVEINNELLEHEYEILDKISEILKNNK